jgi:hypothetical protein
MVSCRGSDFKAQELRHLKRFPRRREKHDARRASCVLSLLEERNFQDMLTSPFSPYTPTTQQVLCQFPSTMLKQRRKPEFLEDYLEEIARFTPRIQSSSVSA